MPKQKKEELSSSNWIVKSNKLNEIRHTKMTLTQTRLFSIYLSKINPMDISSREVTFKLDEYAKIMAFKRFNITKLRKTFIDLTRLVVHFIRDTNDYDEKTGLRGFEMVSSLLFKRFKLYKDDNDEWTVSIDCHDDVLYLMFELKKHFFKYKLFNALRLASPNQQRMYELLKQYEYVGAREISVKDLREFLGLKENEYPRWDNFRYRILETSQIALEKYTDIKFTWEVVGKRGKGGKINTLKFNIEKNDNHEQQLTLDDFMFKQLQPEIDGDIEEFEQRCNNEFDPVEMQVLHNLT